MVGRAAAVAAVAAPIRKIVIGTETLAAAAEAAAVAVAVADGEKRVDPVLPWQCITMPRLR